MSGSHCNTHLVSKTSKFAYEIVMDFACTSIQGCRVTDTFIQNEICNWFRLVAMTLHIQIVMIYS